MATRGSPPEWWTHRSACPKCGQVHERCSAHKGDGSPCGRWPRRGHWVCATHGGGARQVKAAAEKAEARVQAAAAVERLGLGQGAVVIDPAEAMLAAVHEAAYNVEVYRRALADLDVDLGRPGERYTVALELWGKESNRIAPHTLVELYNAERDRLVKYSAECRRAGVEERRIEITAELGRQMVEILRAALTVTFSAVRAALVAGELTRARLDALEVEEVPLAVAAEVSRIRSERSAA